MNNYAAGAISGLVETSITFPLDTIKTRLQSGSGKTLIKGIYNGFFPKLIGVPLMRMLFWGVKEHTMNKTNNLILSGAMAGLAQSIIDTPIERYKIHSQLNISKNIAWHKQIQDSNFASSC